MICQFWCFDLFKRWDYSLTSSNRQTSLNIHSIPSLYMSLVGPKSCFLWGSEERMSSCLEWYKGWLLWFYLLYLCLNWEREIVGPDYRQEKAIDLSLLQRLKLIFRFYVFIFMVVFPQMFSLFLLLSSAVCTNIHNHV